MILEYYITCYRGQRRSGPARFAKRTDRGNEEEGRGKDGDPEDHLPDGVHDAQIFERGADEPGRTEGGERAQGCKQQCSERKTICALRQRGWSVLFHGGMGVPPSPSGDGGIDLSG